MPGQFRFTSKDKKHTITIGSADDKKRSASAFVSQQDNKGNKTSTVYDSKHRVVKEITKKRNA